MYNARLLLRRLLPNVIGNIGTVNMWVPSSLCLLKGLVAQSCPTLCDSMDCSLPGSSVRWILRQEYCSGLPFTSPGDLPDLGIEPGSPACRRILYRRSHQGSPCLHREGYKSLNCLLVWLVSLHHYNILIWNSILLEQKCVWLQQYPNDI